MFMYVCILGELRGDAKGYEKRRQLWSDTNNVKIIESLPGGGSAKGSPCDAVHAKWRALTDQGEAHLLGHTDDVVTRQRLEEVFIRTAAKDDISIEDLIHVNLWAWEGMPAPIMRWAWVSRGLASLEDMAEFHGIPIEELKDDSNIAERWGRQSAGVPDSVVPIANPTTEGEEANPTRRTEFSWLIAAEPAESKANVPADGWRKLPEWLQQAVTRESADYSNTGDNLRKKILEASARVEKLNTAGSRRSLATCEAKLKHHFANKQRTVFFDPLHKKELTDAQRNVRKKRGTLKNVNKRNLPIVLDLEVLSIAIQNLPARFLTLASQTQEFQADSTFNKLSSLLAAYQPPETGTDDAHAEGGRGNRRNPQGTDLRGMYFWKSFPCQHPMTNRLAAVYIVILSCPCSFP